MEIKEQKCSLWPIGTSVTIKKLMENARKIGETFFGTVCIVQCLKSLNLSSVFLMHNFFKLQLVFVKSAL